MCKNLIKGVNRNVFYIQPAKEKKIIRLPSHILYRIYRNHYNQLFYLNNG